MSIFECGCEAQIERDNEIKKLNDRVEILLDYVLAAEEFFKSTDADDSSYDMTDIKASRAKLGLK